MSGVAYSYIFKGLYLCIWFDIQKKEITTVQTDLESSIKRILLNDQTCHYGHPKTSEVNLSSNYQKPLNKNNSNLLFI
jgi:hypothetical protein